MRISYIPPVVKDPVQISIENALLSVVVNPFKNWIYSTTSKLFILGEWGLILGCAIGIIMMMFKIDDGKKISKKCAVIFISLEIIKVVIL